MIVSTPPSRRAPLTRRGFLKAGVRTGIGLGALSLSSMAWAKEEVDWLELREVEVKLPRLPRSFDGFRLAQISDIHIECGDMSQRLPELSRYVTSLGADAIAVTGDFTSGPDNWQEDSLVAGLQYLSAPNGVFGVLGNHDQWGPGGDRRRIGHVARAAMARSGIRELSNAVFPLERDGERLWICGVDDWLFNAHDLEAVTAALPAKSCAILLAHEPDFADEVATTKRFDLMLSGHSHGGQIALPVLGPITLPPGGRKYPNGRYQIEDLTLYTNRGIGVVGIPLRLCARPEVTVFTLKAAD